MVHLLPFSWAEILHWDEKICFSNAPVPHPLMLVCRRVAESLARWSVSLIWQFSLIARLKYKSKPENCNDTNDNQKPISKLRLFYLTTTLKPRTNFFLTSNWAWVWSKLASDPVLTLFLLHLCEQSKTHMLYFDQLFKDPCMKNKN